MAEIERYVIRSELGRGGMGVVYSARDTLRAQAVAFKRLSVERFTTASALERATTLFEREFHTLSQLAHPHVISVYDYGIDAVGPYYTMELLVGANLRDHTPLPWREAVALIRDVASALAIVHSRRLVHRDVTPLNIHCTDSGAKLIDFGALIPMGVAKQLVGTPPFIAPECVQSQPLDGQTDLFALGACLFFAISGRHAFPARDIDGLRYVWERTPPALSHHVSDVPESLDALVSSLLSLHPAGRPRTAADVYEQLTNIADLPRSESEQVARAYLTKPALVGRGTESSVIQKSLERVKEGHGSTLMIVGPSGSGRTRCLDAALLDAQLAGLRTARADATEGIERPFAALNRVWRGLHDAGLAVDEARRFAQLATETYATLDAARRQHTLQALTLGLLELSERTPLAIGVDDLDGVDDASLAVLASLAVQLSEHRMLLVATSPSDTKSRPNAALRLLRETSQQLQLSPLDAEHSKLLLSSLFGEVPNLAILSELCQRRCLGNPRQLMESAQATIDAGLVRHEIGGWLISDDVVAISGALDRGSDLARQLAELSVDAVDLLEALALDVGDVTTLADYTALTSHGDSARMHRAVNELTSSGWLVTHEDRARFRRADQRALLSAHIPVQRARAIHARLAERSVKPGLTTLYEAYHLVCAGAHERALVAVDKVYRTAEQQDSSDIMRNPLALETIELFCEIPMPANAHPASRANEVTSFVNIGILQGRPELVASKCGLALREVAPFSGMADYRALSHLPPPERLSEALQRAHARCQVPGVDGLDLLGAIRRQTQVSLTTAVCARYMLDPSLLDDIPDLGPFTALSPALGLALRVLDGLCKLTRGQTFRAWDALREAHAWVVGALSAQVDTPTRMALQLPLLGFLCSIEAEHASPDASALLDELSALLPHSALALRASHHLYLGNLAKAAAARKESELLSVQTTAMLETRVSSIAQRLDVAVLSDNAPEIRRAHAEIVQVAKTRPGWRHRVAVARCHMLRCQARCAEGLELAERELTNFPLQHCDFVLVATTRLELLLADRRFEPARELATQLLDSARAADVPSYRVELMLARAHAELGEHVRAEAVYTTALATMQARRIGGIQLGRAFETGARLALLRGDRLVFSERSELCARYYSISDNPPLAARQARLLREAERVGLLAAERSVVVSPTQLPTALRALAETGRDDDFYAGVLDYLLKQTGAVDGHLFVPTQAGLRCVASSGAAAADSGEIERLASDCYARDASVASASANRDEQAGLELDTRDRAFWPCLLARGRGPQRSVAGVVVFIANTPSIQQVPQSVQDQAVTLLDLHADTEATRAVSALEP